MSAFGSGRRICRWLVMLVIVPGSVAQAAVDTAEQSAMFDNAYLIQVLVALILVFGSLYGLVFLLRKFNGMPVNSRRSLRVVSSLKVGTREKIMLIETGESQLLLGVTAGGISALHAFGNVDVESGEIPATGADFADLLPSSAQPEARQ